MWEILLKEKGGQEGRDQSLGTGTEEEKKERYREKREEEVEIGGVLPVKWTGRVCLSCTQEHTARSPRGRAGCARMLMYTALSNLVWCSFL